MNTVAGLTGIGLVTLVLFTSSVARIEPVGDPRAEQRRVAARRDAKEYGLDPKALESDPVYNRELFSRTGPRHYLLHLQKKAADVAKRD